MTGFDTQIKLGRTGLKVGRLGISSSYGTPAGAIEEAFERGCNYFTWGGFLRRRSSGMRTAIGRIVQAGRRDQLVLAVVSYAHNALLTEFFLKKGLKSAGVEYADVLILGYFPRRPSRRVIDGALHLQYVLAAYALCHSVGLIRHRRVGDNLGHSPTVAQIHKDQSTVVAAAIDPTGHSYRLTGILGA